MTQILKLRNFFAVTAFAAAASASLFATSGQASASVLECKGKSPGAVIACCQEEVRRHGKPMWMRVNQQSCNKRAVSCKKQTYSASAQRCWYNPLFAQIDNNDKDSGRGQRGSKY